MILTDPTQLTLAGEFQERVSLALTHLRELNTAEMRKEFTHPDDFWHWGADYMGRWIAATGYLERYTRQDAGVEAVVNELLHFQNQDGSFGTYTDPHDFQEWFGMGRVLIGLVEYYQMSGAENVLAAARRLGDYYTVHYPDYADTLYECYSNGLEGVVALARLTGENQYLACARRMAATSAVYQSIRYSTHITANGRRSPHAGQVHCQLSTARGLLDLYELTGERQYLQPVLDLQDYICNELLWVSGGIGFYYFRPEENETCADADWLRLNLQLWHMTGETRYMDLAERTLLNQLFFNQADNGAFCYLRGLHNRAGAVFDACCSHHGPRALYEAMRYIYTTNDYQVWVNLYVEGKADLTAGDVRVSFTANRAETPGFMTFTYEIEAAPAQPVTFHLRIPEWASRAEIWLNGALQTRADRAAYTEVVRPWRAGDRLEVKFHLDVQIERGQSIGRHILVQDEVCVRYGPRLFSLNDRVNPSVRLFLFKMQLANNQSTSFRVLSPEQIEARGSTPENENEVVIMTPLAGIGGTPSGAGRIHTMRSPYYKTWIPVNPRNVQSKEEPTTER